MVSSELPMENYSDASNGELLCGWHGERRRYTLDKEDEWLASSVNVRERYIVLICVRLL